MTEYTITLLIIGGIAAIWYSYRWGRDDGRAEGFDAGRTSGLIEGARSVSPGLSGGPREPA